MKRSLALMTAYYGRGRRWPVLPVDAVYNSEGKIVGYNQDRAWRSALHAATS